MEMLGVDVPLVTLMGPVPVTWVTVPLPLRSAWHCQAAAPLFHLRTWPLLQVLVSPTFAALDVPLTVTGKVEATLRTPELLRVTVPPRLTGPPPDIPVPAVTVREEWASMGLVT